MDEVGKKTLKIMRKADWYNNWLLSQIKPNLTGRILEVGAGSGNFTSKISQHGEVTAIDYDPEYKNANYGDIEKGKYFFRDKKFDTIICMNVLEHIKDDKKSLGNMNNLLEQGGRLILLVPAFSFAYGTLDESLGHYRRYTKEEASKKMKRAGFKVIESKYLNWLGLIGWFVNGKIFKKGIVPEDQLKIFDKIARPFLHFENFVKPLFGLSLLLVGEKE